MDKLERIINEWDPIDLLAFCPKDEYENEIYSIRIRARGIMDEKKLGAVIQDVFSKSFDEHFKCDIQECEEIAKSILENSSSNAGTVM